MAFHHVALATRDAQANHEFYTGPMGFKLVKVEIGQMGEAGFAKHLFYETGEGEMIAFWDLHDESILYRSKRTATRACRSAPASACRAPESTDDQEPSGTP